MPFDLTEVSEMSDWSRETEPRADGSKSLIILDSSRDCKWPVGGMHFCGKRRRHGSSYCEHHHQVAHVGDAAA